MNKIFKCKAGHFRRDLVCTSSDLGVMFCTLYLLYDTLFLFGKHFLRDRDGRRSGYIIPYLFGQEDGVGT